MKLIVDAGNTGSTQECDSVADALVKLREIIPQNAQSVRVEIEAPELCGGMDGATPITPEPTSGEDIERRTVTALVEQLELLRELAKTRYQTMGIEANAELTHAMCNLSGRICGWLSGDRTRLVQRGATERADILTISMTAEEARVRIAQLPENHRGRIADRNFATMIFALGLTPAQAQATLALTWNRVINESTLSFPLGRATENSLVDLAGYAACGGEIATERESSPEQGNESWKPTFS